MVLTFFDKLQKWATKIGSGTKKDGGHIAGGGKTISGRYAVLCAGFADYMRIYARAREKYISC